jgi:hypothetical protein
MAVAFTDRTRRKKCPRREVVSTFFKRLIK